MNVNIKAELENLMTKWVEEHSASVYWPDCIFGDQLVEHMANAAEIAFDSAVDSSMSAERVHTSR